MPRNKIKQLDQLIIAQIAAGEVIDNPTSIIKELLDNAIDAQATQITIDLEQAGQNQIKIIDNGMGMSSADLSVCYLPHTTSKLTKIDDLFHLQTLGFRGEALSSIASVANLIIESKTKSAMGWQIEVNQGQQQSLSPIGMPNGTQVKVTHLFATIPARKKFLANKATELKHILTMLTNYALIYPDINFQLKNDDKTIADFSTAKNWQERIETILGAENLTNYLKLEYQQPMLQISGFISLPGVARFSHAHQFLFINQRPVSSKILSATIKKAYGELIEPKAQPQFILSIQISPTLIDINVHPQKKLINFLDQQYISQLLEMMIHSRLAKADLFSPDTSLNQLELNDPGLLLKNNKANPYTSKLLKKVVQAWETTQTREKQEIIQIHDLYLATQTADGLLLIDQHAAHERILYQQFLAEYQHQSQKSERIKLEQPLELTLSMIDSQALSDNLDIFTKIGFEINPLKNNRFQITAIPNFIDPQRIKPIISEVIDDLHSNRTLQLVDSQTHKTLAFLACRLAIKQGESLNFEQRKNLIEKLSQTDQNYTCPHGRPTHQVISLLELEKMFHRK